ncbi:MAG TPA: hypothetical protein ENF87_02450 [Thermoproteales archaeon]|nr:hypothetical protein [Thermoproteales archaeon]
MKTAVVNSTPLIYLSKASAIHLLYLLYNEILIPKAVYYDIALKLLNKLVLGGFRISLEVYLKALDEIEKL